MVAPMSIAAIKGHLSAVPLFSALSDAELDFVASSVRSAVFRKGARIFEEGAAADCCYVLIAGRAKVVQNTADGDEHLVTDVIPGDLSGEIALLDGFPRSAALVAAEVSEFFVIPAAVFHTLRKNPAFERRLVGHVTSRLRDRTDHVRRVATGPSIQRVAWCLGSIAMREGRRDGGVVIIPKKPHHELAGMAGCSRETVTRALSVLKRKKYVSWDAQTMRLEMERLQRYIRDDMTADARAGVIRT
jgi:CRP-like cAMP-binding protein